MNYHSSKPFRLQKLAKNFVVLVYV